ncbi:MAG: molybdopterin molybdotransferase MoeA [Sphingomonadaceae bacterium]
MSQRPAPIPLEEAQSRLLALCEPLRVERVAVADALGFYLAETLDARRTQPAADLSAMDGYAVAFGDMAGPWRVIGESAAGHPFSGSIRKGEAVRIATGAVLPDGAGAVILQEDIAREGDTISLSGEPPSPPDKHIRRKGMDFGEGELVLPAGVRLGPAQAALAIAAGYTVLPVRHRPRIAVLDSGDELAAAPGALDPHRMPASNGVMLAAMAKSLPCEARALGPVADSMAAMAEALSRAGDVDILVTSGGASVGDHDLVKPALEAWGAKIDFWRVAIKPGKPLLVATREAKGRRQLILGLPGNPVSSFVTAQLFMLPLLRHLLGAADAMPKKTIARATENLPANGSRQTFLRARWDGEFVTPVANQDSSALSALAGSNALIDRPVDAPATSAGDAISVILLENGGIA